MPLRPTARGASLTGGALALVAATATTTALLMPHPATAETRAPATPTAGATPCHGATGHGRLVWHVALPQLRGAGHVGTNLRITHVRPHAFRPAATSFTYQWLRGGAPIPGAHSTIYRLTAEDSERKIAVRVTGHRSGYRPGSIVSNTVKVAR